MHVEVVTITGWVEEALNVRITWREFDIQCALVVVTVLVIRVNDDLADHIVIRVLVFVGRSDGRLQHVVACLGWGPTRSHVDRVLRVRWTVHCVGEAVHGSELFDCCAEYVSTLVEDFNGNRGLVLVRVSAIAVQHTRQQTTISFWNGLLEWRYTVLEHVPDVTVGELNR